MRIATVAGLCGMCLVLTWEPWFVGAAAQDRQQDKVQAPAALEPAFQAQLNDHTVSVMAGTNHDGTGTIIQDMAAALDDGTAFRVVPMVGQGPAQTLIDVMALHGVDLGITHATVLNHFADMGGLGPIRDQVVYVAKLFNEELHVLTRTDIADIEALAGKTVNVGREGSGSEITTRLLFAALDLDVNEVHLDAADALNKLEAGEIDATILIGAAPTPHVAHVTRSSGLKLLSLPYARGLEGKMYPASLTAEDYPALIEKGERIDTVSVSAVLIARDPEREAQSADAAQNKLDLFVTRFFANFEALQDPPSHPKWREVSLGATLKGWRRLAIAEQWIETARARAVADARERERFKTFLARAGKDAPSAEDREALFRAFKAWSETEAATQASN